MRKYTELRRAMRQADIDQAYLAGKLLVTRQAISQRLTARTPWRIDEAYEVLRILNRPTTDLIALFPPGGTYIEKL